MRYACSGLLLMLLGVAPAAPAQINIGINISLFPELVRVPDYPVYYAPRQNANYFFYDGLYWVFLGDVWYSSDWCITDPECGSPRNMCRYTCCASRCGITAVLLRTLAAGSATRRRGGANIGAAIGNSAVPAGTTGTAAPRRHPRRCPRISGNIRETVIRGLRKDTQYKTRSTVTSRRTSWCASTCGRKYGPRRRMIHARKSARRRAQRCRRGSTRAAAQRRLR